MITRHVTKSKRKGLLVAFVLIALFASACSRVNTSATEHACVYGGGTGFESENLKGDYGPGSGSQGTDFGPGDVNKIYEIDDRSYIFNGDSASATERGVDAGRILVPSGGTNPVQVKIEGDVNFSFNTDIATGEQLVGLGLDPDILPENTSLLCAFDLKHGQKWGVADDNGLTDGWDTFLKQKFAGLVEETLRNSADPFTWRQMYTNAQTDIELSDGEEIQDQTVIEYVSRQGRKDLEEKITRSLGAPFFRVREFRIERPEPVDQELLENIAAIEAQVSAQEVAREEAKTEEVRRTSEIEKDQAIAIANQTRLQAEAEAEFDVVESRRVLAQENLAVKNLELEAARIEAAAEQAKLDATCPTGVDCAQWVLATKAAEVTVIQSPDGAPVIIGDAQPLVNVP